MTLATLTTFLIAETQTLKDQYLERTKEWSAEKYERIMSRKSYTNEQWCKLVGVTSVNNNFPKGFYNTKESIALDRYQKELNRVSYMSIEEYQKADAVKALDHYTLSISKLATRVFAKDLDFDNLTISTTHIGRNIETVLTDSKKSVRAFTVLAWGPINAPHYRYLVK